MMRLWAEKIQHGAYAAFYRQSWVHALRRQCTGLHRCDEGAVPGCQASLLCLCNRPWRVRDARDERRRRALAGRPILAVLSGSSLGDCTVVVTRSRNFTFEAGGRCPCSTFRCFVKNHQEFFCTLGHHGWQVDADDRGASQTLMAAFFFTTSCVEALFIALRNDF